MNVGTLAMLGTLIAVGGGAALAAASLGSSKKQGASEPTPQQPKTATASMAGLQSDAPQRTTPEKHFTSKGSAELATSYPPHYGDHGWWEYNGANNDPAANPATRVAITATQHVIDIADISPGST